MSKKPDGSLSDDRYGPAGAPTITTGGGASRQKAQIWTSDQGMRGQLGVAGATGREIAPHQGDALDADRAVSHGRVRQCLGESLVPLRLAVAAERDVRR